jgi:hypothetical protein
MSIMRIPTMFILVISIIPLILIIIVSIFKNIVHSKRTTAIIKIIVITAVVFGGRMLLNYSGSEKLPVPMGNKYDNKYVINLDKVNTTTSGTKVKIKKVFLDLKYVSMSIGVKGKDKLVALELKKSPDDEKPLQKMQGQWVGSRWSYEYNSFGMPYRENEFIDPLYAVCYLSNGEELTFEIQDSKDVKNKTELIRINKNIEDDGRKLTIKDMTRAVNYTNVSAKSEGYFGEIEVSILNNNVESEKTTGSWAGGGSTYDYDFSFKPIQEGNIILKVTVKNSGKEYILDVK